MVEIFVTNVSQPAEAAMILQKLRDIFPGYTANFDLHDCDRVLRVDAHGMELCPALLMTVVKKMGYSIDLMPDIIDDTPTHYFRGQTLR